MTTSSIRDDFPLLRRRIDGRPVIYLDSAATSLKPRQTIEAMQRFSYEFSANVHRGKHTLSQEASEAYENARRAVARFINTSPRRIVFTRNATESLNLVAQGCDLSPGDVVLTWKTEHHSNLVPWMQRAKVIVVDSPYDRPHDLQALRDAIEQHGPKVVAVGHVSNVTGVVQPIAEICALARSYGVTTVIDAAQGIAHTPIDVEAIGCDFLAFSGHKMLGPMGIGVLFGREDRLEQLQPMNLGGGMVELVTNESFTLKAAPYRFEGGTPNVEGAIGLAAAIEYIEHLGFDEIQKHDRQLASALREAVADIPGFVVMMANEPLVAIASLVPQSETITADEVAVALSETYKIMVRSGHHCCHPLFDSLGFAHGGVRASAYIYNTVDEISQLGAALRVLAGRLLR